jgi:hypothetical protein
VLSDMPARRSPVAAVLDNMYCLATPIRACFVTSEEAKLCLFVADANFVSRYLQKKIINALILLRKLNCSITC